MLFCEKSRLGFVLGEVKTVITQRQKRKWIKQLVKREIQYNIDHLNGKKLNDRLATRSTQIWGSQLESMPGVFQEKEFDGIHTFYIELNETYRSAGEQRIVNQETMDLIQSILAKGNPINA